MTRLRRKALRDRGQTGLLRCVSTLLMTERSALLMSRRSRRGLMQQCRLKPDLGRSRRHRALVAANSTTPYELGTESLPGSIVPAAFDELAAAL